ncbi:uncharacterized protein LOC128858834 [Anastrepha ludens]|uniref:uncharacterized protein LOC128858834 n=1 Tax=Anastrepha ludens TaxID=28586 RepID=UPI0023B09636|nr:uncharacterized protein LOC128858834 [Anastrepha ludens]
MDWRHSEILKLIYSYRQYECLWNCHIPDYKQQDLRKSSWIELSKQFNKDVDEIKKKIKHLRTCYIVEKKKVESRLDINGEPTYEPHLYYYNQMTFLDPVVILRNQLQNEDPLTEHKTRPSVQDRIVVAPKRQRSNSSDFSEESFQLETEPPKRRPDSVDFSPKSSPQIEPKVSIRRLVVNDTPRQVPQRVTPTPRKKTLSKEDTFCAMLCSELKLLKSEETYDNVTSEIFSAVKNAKISDRQIEYQLEDDCKNLIRRT